MASYSGTANLYRQMVASAKSLVANAPVDKIYFLTEGDFDLDVPSGLVEVLDVHDQDFFPQDGPNMSSRYSYMSLMRAALAFVLEDEHDVLSLDCDVIADRDCLGAWDNLICGDVSDDYFSAALETHRTHNGFTYHNTGVCHYNLEELRKSGKAGEVIDVLNRQQYTWVEQDVFNYLCQGRIRAMDARYNWNEWTMGTAEEGTLPAIVHYAGIDSRLWTTWDPYLSYLRMSWEEAVRLGEESHG